MRKRLKYCIILEIIFAILCVTINGAINFFQISINKMEIVVYNTIETYGNTMRKGTKIIKKDGVNGEKVDTNLVFKKYIRRWS